MATYVLAAFRVNEDDPETAKGVVRNSTAFACVGASPLITDGRIFAVASEEEYLGSAYEAPEHDRKQLATTIVDSLEDYGVLAENLDDEVHDLKSREGSAINNSDLQGQVEYLLEQGYTEVQILHATGKALSVPCCRCEAVVPKRLAIQARAGADKWICASCR